MASITKQEIELLHYYICEGISDPHRLQILYLIASQPHNVSELTDSLDISQSTVSHHLRILRDRGLVVSERDGNSIYYSIRDDRVLVAMDILRNVVGDLLEERADILNSS